jgi:hypothetical protein
MGRADAMMRTSGDTEKGSHSSGSSPGTFTCETSRDNAVDDDDYYYDDDDDDDDDDDEDPNDLILYTFGDHEATQRLGSVYSGISLVGSSRGGQPQQRGLARHLDLVGPARMMTMRHRGERPACLGGTVVRILASESAKKKLETSRGTHVIEAVEDDDELLPRQGPKPGVEVRDAILLVALRND